MKNRKGFSFVEFLIIVAIIGLAAGLIGMVFKKHRVEVPADANSVQASDANSTQAALSDANSAPVQEKPAKAEPVKEEAKKTYEIKYLPSEESAQVAVIVGLEMKQEEVCKSYLFGYSKCFALALEELTVKYELGEITPIIESYYRASLTKALIVRIKPKN